MDDIINVCIFLLYAKLSVAQLSPPQTGLLHVDTFCRRIDRKEFRGGSTILQLPTPLRKLWEAFSNDLLNQLQACIVIVAGHSARQFYEARLQASGKRFERLFVGGMPKYANEMPAAWLEYDSDSSITRLALGLFHPEGFLRTHSAFPGEIQHYMAFRESLLDFAAVLINRKPNLTSFLSSARYYFQVSTGTIIPLTRFEDFLAGRDSDLADGFKRPTLNTATLDGYVKNMPTLSASFKRIADMRK